MSNHSVAVVGVLYPGVEPYLNAYLRALEQQTFNRFDLVLANDGLSDAESYLQNVRLKVVLHTASGSIAAIRRDLIETVVRAGYDFIVFTDCDDYISCNRLEVCNRLLGRSAIVSMTLMLFLRMARSSSYVIFPIGSMRGLYWTEVIFSTVT